MAALPAGGAEGVATSQKNVEVGRLPLPPRIAIGLSGRAEGPLDLHARSGGSYPSGPDCALHLLAEPQVRDEHFERHLHILQRLRDLRFPTWAFQVSPPGWPRARRLLPT